ncbi:MAG: hypothetical protein N3B16_04205 [Candidatus Aminicenantes bacterium]|nr:hypothetical protein [Candidatus Aminicenantes bacterium]
MRKKINMGLFMNWRDWIKATTMAGSWFSTNSPLSGQPQSKISSQGYSTI